MTPLHIFIFLLLFPYISARNCSTAEFGCVLSGECISISKWQDGIDDCWDGTDEVCLPWQLDCRFGSPRCVGLNKTNDGKIDCYSALDEPSLCPSHFFVCSDRSGCIPPSQFNDGSKQCKDGSDEPCPPGHFPCSSGECVDGEKFQDGHTDCDDGSDEECLPSQFPCPCGRVRCVSPSLVGNGDWDCEDGADEQMGRVYGNRTCANGEKPRMSDSIMFGNVTVCEQRPSQCEESLGQVCIVAGGTWRCVCKLGTVRPVGSAKCIPIELMPQYLANPLSNCSAAKSELRKYYGSSRFTLPPSASSERRYSSKGWREWRTTQAEKKTTHREKTTHGVETTHAAAGQTTKTFEMNEEEESQYPTPPPEDALPPCPTGMSPINGKCMVLLDECSSHAHDCHPNAVCIDNPSGYECLCREGYLDTSPHPVTRPGRNCTKLVDECAVGEGNECDVNARCIDKPSGYTCRCSAGFVDVGSARRPGRNCTRLVDECSSGSHDCSPTAACADLPQGFLCLCPPGSHDLSPDPNKPGRVCAPASSDCGSECDVSTSECDRGQCKCRKGFHTHANSTKCIPTGNNPCQDYSLHDCDPIAECVSEQPGYFDCACPRGFTDLSPDPRFPGRKCSRVIDECALGTHSCDGNADCVDTPEGYTCRCRAGYTDSGVDRLRAPGRTCTRGNMCAHMDCAAEAECRETPSGPLCTCVSGYVDVSRQHGKAPGRVCRQVVNECALRQHDCSSHAACIDTADGYTCRCNDGFRDESPQSTQKPGRVCVQSRAPERPECDVADPMSCAQSKSEVCRFMDNTYKCACANGYSRLPDGRCLVINECEDARLNTCDRNAECIDLAEGYTCACRSGFADVSVKGEKGRHCRARVNECGNKDKYQVDCHRHAVCMDTDDGYACQCRPGFADVSAAFAQLPGRRCVEAVNECLSEQDNDCDKNAVCDDAKEGYACTCRPGYVDASPNTTHYPGRVCRKPVEVVKLTDVKTSFQVDSCDVNHPKCAKNEVCGDRTGRGHSTCECAENAFRFEDGTCRVYSACSSTHDCHPAAACLNTFDGYSCQCRPGYIDISADPTGKPGRKCKELLNECASAERNTCDRNAKCIDATDGYACQCLSGFVDTSSQHGLAPGRRCVSASNECSLPSLNTCDENADCIDTQDSYLCQCYAGFVDVSSSAGLPPGRVCTVQTTCPKQKTDLVFLIDGSGSIGSYVFKHEVLRFVREFAELFDIGPQQTRVGLIQYSDQIRHEFDLNQYHDKTSVLRAIMDTQYLTGLTRTGAAIQHMVQEGFSERRGARPTGQDVVRVAIVLTDGRSQDNVTMPAKAARALSVNTFAIGVTDHVLASELESIAGSPHRWFYVDKFKDLDTRLRSMIQKAACPSVQREPTREGSCNARTQTGCDRSLNELCVERNGVSQCVCPEGFHRHPTTRVCGGDVCNPQLSTSCAFPELCQQTPLSNHRCACPAGYERDYRTGFCVSDKVVHISSQQDADCHNGGTPCPSNERCMRDRSGGYGCVCLEGMERSPFTGRCGVPGGCDPSDPHSCDVRKREKCLPRGQWHTCQCAPRERRHAVTGVCLRNECELNEDDCDASARCIDTDDSYLCACPAGFIDRSPDVVRRPGRLCVAEQNECTDGTNRCSPNAFCSDTESGYVCRCKPGFVDYSPNPNSFPGLVCRALVNECANPNLNDCSMNAICVDTQDAYTCVCKSGFEDMDGLRRPGRRCEQPHRNDRCQPGRNECDRNARCVQIGDDDYSCACPAGYKDKSPDMRRPGRVCIPVIPECDNPTLNDCDSPDRAQCIDMDEGYDCRCRSGFLDISPDRARRPGRLCKQLQNECALGLHDCSRDGGICEDTPDSYTCRCAINYLDVSFDRSNRPGRKCKQLLDECVTGQNDCSPEATCTDTEDSYVCACPPTHIDRSADPVNRPGRRCLRRVNECRENRHDCSPNADCIDTLDSFECRCRDDFSDGDPSRRGRVCRPVLVDECRLGKHDCHPNADCHDLPQGYTCQCRAGFLDNSPQRVMRPGRQCDPRPTPPPEECSLDSLRGCNPSKNEVCRLVGGVPKCSCPVNYQRDAIGVCNVINECLIPSLTDCHPSAECIDQPVGYTCRCLSGFRDVGSSSKPGRSCRQLIDECRLPHLNDCHQNAQCIDMEEGYDCKCKQGFKDISQGRPGRLCRRMVNECEDAKLNSCDKRARCVDEEDGYRCECPAGMIDISPSSALKGRACRQLMNECANPSLNDCDRHAKCEDTQDSYTCECPDNSRDISPSPAFPGRVCLMFENECETGRHDCDAHAICRDNEQAFTCECPAGYTDRSPNRLTRPGRVCIQLVNECTTGRHTCSAQADCRDLEQGYTCECKPGYIDRSPNMQTQPGRVCGTPEVCPSDHQCSSAAVCEPLGGEKYDCTCIQGYIDQSPSGQKGRICVRNNACRDPKLNTCSQNAVCYDEMKGYRCECARGYIDRSPSPSEPGRICEAPKPPTLPPRHPCQDPERNDCHAAATCRSTGPQSYTCECLSGYKDRSPAQNKPGRVCVLVQPVCLDASRNDCHAAAICSEDSSMDGGYTCKCRDGYTDQSPSKRTKPGRICVEQVNECLDRSLNDCDPSAVCEDQVDGYTCRCPANARDTSPDASRPGRRCKLQVNECANPSLHNCSRFAECIDKEDGFSCRCRTGYHDENPSKPGTTCKYIINECDSPNLNDCHRHAECVDTMGGYDCRCRQPYRDESPSGLKGRMCTLNECADPSLNNCDKNARCVDMEDGYTCECGVGYYDESPDPRQPGRVCLQFQTEDRAHHVTHRPLSDVDRPNCGRERCDKGRNEVCIGGSECGCRPGEARASREEKCRRVEHTPINVRVVSRNQRPLLYSSEYGSEKSPAYVEMVDTLQKDIAKTFGDTSFANRYVRTRVEYITHPKTVNSSWPEGLLFHVDVETEPASEPVDECALFSEMSSSLQRTNDHIGGGQLRVAADNDLLDPCRRPEDVHDDEPTCGGQKCDEKKGQVCIAESVCGCPEGMRAAMRDGICRVVESWSVPMWVVRDHSQNIVYDKKLGNPMTPEHKEMTRRLEHGIAECYPNTLLNRSFVSVDVNELGEPALQNATWMSGVMVNSTVHFVKGAVRNPSDVYYQLMRYITDKNGYEVGDSKLYLSPVQADPFKPCFKNSCHPKGICIDVGATYRCECSAGFRDLNPDYPGHKCLPIEGFNECERPEDNECSENARCIDLEHLYKCECLPSFTDASPKGTIPGSVCVLDYCSDVNFCPQNTTCHNLEQQAECKCDRGFTDIRRSDKRVEMGVDSETLCMHLRDVDECALGLTNCSGVAECTDKALGYSCACPAGYVDGNPDEPGRVCGALLCDLCNSHGDCVHNPQTNNITCACTDGWAGEFCEVAPSNASMVLLILLALLFLLLTLCCLLYLCSKCHCFRGAAGLLNRNGYGYGGRAGAWPWNTLEGSSSSESGAEFSAASGHEYYPDIGIPRAKLKAGGQEMTMQSSRSNEASRLEEYLGNGAVHIPRARLAGEGAARGAVDESFDSMSAADSEYTIKEEVERKVITDVNVKEIKTTTTTDADGQTHVTTTEYVYPGGRHGGAMQSTARGGRMAAHEEEEEMSEEEWVESTTRRVNETTRSGVNTSSAADYASSGNMMSSSMAAGSRHEMAAGSAHLDSTHMSSMHDVMSSERERGESVAEFSNGRHRSAAAAADSRELFASENREVEEYESEEEGDRRVRRSQHHSFEPLEGGGVHKMKNEESVTTQSSYTTHR